MTEPTPLYAGPDRRRAEDRIADARLLALEMQMADIAVTMRESVAAGLRDAVADPQVWEAAGRAMREQAQSAAGGWLLGGVSTVGKRIGWALVIGGGVYLLGGWSALVALVKAQGGRIVSVDPVTAVADLANTVIGRLWPDKTEQERAQMAAALTIVQGQLAANQAEAGSTSAFTSGWRPAIGWVCGIALACQYIVRPVLTWATALTGHPMPMLPGLDDTLWQLLLGMLGLGGLRTYEKVQGVSK